MSDFPLFSIILHEREREREREREMNDLIIFLYDIKILLCYNDINKN